MRRFVPIIALAGLAIPLLGAAPAAAVKEPNAVFAYDVDAQNRRITATLFDRLRGKALDHLDARVDFALGSVGGPSDMVQFSAATKKIYLANADVSKGFEGKGMDEIQYDVRILEAGFDWKDPTAVFTCKRCGNIPWILHPNEPKLYLSLADPLDNGDESRSAKLVEVTLSPVRRTRVISRVPRHAELRFTPDGTTIYAFGRAAGSRKPYGQLVTVRLKGRKRSSTTVNFPTHNALKLPMTPQTSDVSPDALEIAYHFGVIDVLTGDAEGFLEEETRDLSNATIGWSRESDLLLYQTEEAPLYYDRKIGWTWELPVDDAVLIAWAPAQTAILFQKDHGDIGYYDLERRSWTHVFEAGPHFTGGAAWVTLPTKRVPKR